MWWNHQNMDKPIKTKDGLIWEFAVWHEMVNGVHQQKIYFWDQAKKVAGMMELNEPVHRNKLKDKMKKVATDKNFRDKYTCELKFPIEKNYY